MSKELVESKRLEREESIPDYDYLFDDGDKASGRNVKRHFLWRIIRHNFWKLLISTFFFIIKSSPVWVLPVVTANVINIASEGLTDGAVMKLVINGIVILVLILQNIFTHMIYAKIVDNMLRGVSAGIKCAVVRQLQQLSITYHKDMQTGKIQSKFLKDIEAVDGLLRNIVTIVIPTVIGFIVATAISIYKSGIVSLFFLLVIPCNILFSMGFRKKISSSNRSYRVETESMSARLTNMLEMLPVTKSHGLEETEISAVRTAIARVKRSGLEVDRTNAYFGSWIWIVNTLLNVVCLFFCVILALNKKIGVGDVVLYQSLFNSIGGYVTCLVNIIPQLGSGQESLTSVSEIMNVTDIENNAGKMRVGEVEGNVRFENVRYRYPDGDRDIIKDFNLDVKKGECIALVGASGSGKSTIMNMIIGFLKPTEGELYIDGRSVENIDLPDYRQHIAVVPQSSILFAGTIRENITYGLQGYSEEKLQKVVEMANLNEFLKEDPKGIDMFIGEHGDKLSGGQKQRITIARALIRDPAILILDEATSALDNVSEYQVQQAIEKSIAGRTTFIVAHRLSTIRNADRIIVMDEGRCVECGTYEELMALKGKFYELKSLNDLNMKRAQESLD